MFAWKEQKREVNDAQYSEFMISLTKKTEGFGQVELFSNLVKKLLSMKVLALNRQRFQNVSNRCIFAAG
jgi:hypothetical protein